jgi:putative nucleotidyltransferase with HDIG domain
VDKQTQNHSYRVSRYAEKLAQAAGLPAHEIEEVRTASLLHDLGKISVSADILQKIGSLSAEERAHLSGHAGSGASLLTPFGEGVTKIVPLILYHHERYDGKGYYGLKGKEIPIGAQMISVADVFDALTTDRPYRKALSPMEVKKEIMKDSGTHFAPEVIKCFEEAFPSLLAMSTHHLHQP